MANEVVDAGEEHLGTPAEEPVGGYVDGKGAAAEANSIEIWSENSYRHLGKIL